MSQFDLLAVTRLVLVCVAAAIGACSRPTPVAQTPVVPPETRQVTQAEIAKPAAEPTAASVFSKLTDAEIDAEARRIVTESGAKAASTKTDQERFEEVRDGLLGLRDLARLGTLAEEAEAASATKRPPRDLEKEAEEARVQAEECQLKRKQLADLQRMVREGPNEMVTSREIEKEVPAETRLVTKYLAERCS